MPGDRPPWEVSHPKGEPVIIGRGRGLAKTSLDDKVAVVEKGRRWKQEDFPKTNWNARKYLWQPQLGCYGYQMLTQLKHVLIFHGGGWAGEA